MDSDQTLESVVADSRKKLIASLVRMLPSAEAEEVAQEAFLKLYQSAKKLAPEHVRPYLFKIARNLALSRLRHHKVVVQSNSKLFIQYQLSGDVMSSEELLSNARDKTILLEAINAMPPICRQVFVYRKINEKSHTEIAQLMGISINTVQNHLSNGMKLCRQYILTTQLAHIDSMPSTKKVS